MITNNFLEKLEINEAWGFYGTIRSNYGLSSTETRKLFYYASLKLGKEIPDSIEFLNSPYGRHLADAMSFEGCKKGCTLREAKIAFGKTYREFLRGF